jgi:MT0933-like antitoxin protein
MLAVAVEGGPMGLMDTLKGWVGGHKDQTKQGVDKAADVADAKTGGSHTEQIDSGAEKGKDAIDKLDDGA